MHAQWECINSHIHSLTFCWTAVVPGTVPDAGDGVWQYKEAWLLSLQSWFCDCLRICEKKSCSSQKGNRGQAQETVASDGSLMSWWGLQEHGDSKELCRWKVHPSTVDISVSLAGTPWVPGSLTSRRVSCPQENLIVRVKAFVVMGRGLGLLQLLSWLSKLGELNKFLSPGGKVSIHRK